MREVDIKSESGFTGTDVAIAIMVIVIFITIICAISFNVYISTSSTERTSRANAYIVDILEKVQKLDYDDPLLAVGEYRTDTDNRKILDISIPKGYQVNLKISKYTEMPGNENKQDIIKIIEVNISYLLNKQTKEINIKTLKTV